MKILQIVTTFAFTVAAMEGAAALGAFFAFPATGAIAAIVLGVALAAALIWINQWIAETHIEL
jgi:hypothetical protein